jgi:hypothetical protein
MALYQIADPGSISSVADWAEWYVAHSQESLSRASLSKMMGAASGSDVSDEDLDNVWRELEGRQKLYGPNTPIKVSSRLLESKVDWLDIPGYMACLIFSVTGNIEETGLGGKLFEHISNSAVKSYINGEAVVCGVPRRLTASELAAKVNERFTREYPSFRKDRNLDVLAWKPFQDGRPNQIVMLVQCAAGKNWRTKTKELNLKAWSSYIDFMCVPIKGFTLPDIISDVARFDDYGQDAGVIFDRSRIYRNIVGTTLDTATQKKLITWCKRRIKSMNN